MAKKTSARASKKDLIGVIHLLPLPGSPGAIGEDSARMLERAGHQAIREAQMLAQAGFTSVIVENFGDAPFFKGRVGPETVAAMSVIVAALGEAVRIPVGVNILRNDALSALAVAAVTGADFIRVNVLSGVAATDQGLIESEAAELLRKKVVLAPGLQIWGDVLVKHARTMSVDDVELAVEEVAERSGADAVILTGPTTGRPVDTERLRLARAACKRAGRKLYVGSGLNVQNAQGLLALCDGAIVGSALRKGGRAGAPLDLPRIRSLVKACRSK